MTDSGFLFQNPHRHVALLDVLMLEKTMTSEMSDVRIGRTLLTIARISLLRQ